MKEQWPDRRKSFKKWIAGGGLIGGDAALSWGINAFSFAEASTLGFMKPVLDNHPIVAIGTVLTISTAVGALTSIQNIRLNRQFGLSPHGLATSVFHLVGKKWPERTLLRDVSTGFTQMFTTKDPLVIAPALANETVLVAFITAKTATTAFNFAKSVGTEIVLRKARKKEQD